MEAVLSFILVIGVLIVVHEMGHFLVARKFGVKIEKFSIGFGPKSSPGPLVKPNIVWPGSLWAGTSRCSEKTIRSR